KHVAAQSVNRIIGDLKRFLFGTVGNDSQNGPENFLFRNRHGRGDVAEHRWLYEKPLVQTFRPPQAAADQFRAFVDARLDITPYVLVLRLVYDGSHRGVRVARIAQ